MKEVKSYSEFLKLVKEYEVEQVYRNNELVYKLQYDFNDGVYTYLSNMIVPNEIADKYLEDFNPTSAFINRANYYSFKNTAMYRMKLKELLEGE